MQEHITALSQLTLSSGYAKRLSRFIYVMIRASYRNEVTLLLRNSTLPLSIMNDTYYMRVPFRLLSLTCGFSLTTYNGYGAQVTLSLANGTESGWSMFQQMEDQVLAVSAMFGMFQVINQGAVQLESQDPVMASS